MFPSSVLADLIETMNKPINKYTPILNGEGHSRMAECAQEWGWKWAALTGGTVTTEPFEGGISGREWCGDLLCGVYCGQVVEGKRHGYGIVYCTS